MAAKSSNAAGDAGPPAGRFDGDEFTAAVAAVTNAFGDPTRREIYLYVRQNDGATANAIAEHFELHPNVARHHLEKLAAGGYLEVELGRSPSGAGRPSKRYTARAGDNHLTFPPRRDDLLGTLLARALERLDPNDAAQLAEEVGFDYGRTLAQRFDAGNSQRSVKAALATVADALTAHGFAAHAEGKGTQLAIVSEHCPFGEAANRWPNVMCAVDRGLIRGMLAELNGGDTPVQLSASRPAGDDRCITNI
ncbi:MAG: helix-turn-helix transcriptional regulator [Acidimicrobiia bacterium]